jgi:SAM-dependent methyltransferase
MYYENLNIQVPFNDRALINEKILTIITNNDLAPEISKTDIFNSYTGIGGLHGLKKDDYYNFHEYTEAKKEIENGQFLTPHHLCEYMVDFLQPSENDLIADLTCGTGNFFNFLPNLKNVFGCELDKKAATVAKYLYPDANIQNRSIEFYKPEERFDIIFGNPPFNLQFQLDGEKYVSQLHYMLKAAQLLKKGGLLALIVPETFLNDDFFKKTQIQLIDEQFNFILQYSLDSKSFKHLGVSNFATKIMIFQKKSQYLEDAPFQANQFVKGDIKEVKEKYILPVLKLKESIKHKLLNELYSDLNGNNYSFKNQYFADGLDYVKTKEDKKEKQITISDGFEFKVKKYLFEIKTHDITKPYYTKCFEYFHKFKTQTQPDKMSDAIWMQKKITQQKVIAYLKNVLKKQNQKVKSDTIRLVHNRFNVYLKPYSRKANNLLKKHQQTKHESFNDLVAYDGVTPFLKEDKEYKGIFKLVERKRKDFALQTTPFNDLQRKETIDNYLSSFRFHGKTPDCSFNEIQYEDLGLIIQKKFSILNWQQGCGKTAACFAFSRYNTEKYNLHNTFILSSSISVNLTWTKFLRDNLANYIVINSISDINKIQKNQFVLISTDMLIKYNKFIKKYIKRQAYKVAFIFDESDEITNTNSKRTKAAINAFQKSKVKLLATGTTTRNNIVEFYSQLVLLYNNSVNFLCNCENIYKEVKKDEDDFFSGTEIEEQENENYQMPFSAKHGNNLFKYCFNPSKTTVFGIKKQNQDIYNIDELTKIISYTVITRKFIDIVGKDKYEIFNHRIDQSEEETELYSEIMQSTSSMISQFYKSTGNSRKDSMLKIIRQLQLLIKATTCPNTFNTGIEKPEKLNFCMNKLSKWNDEKVAIGLTYIETLKIYSKEIAELFPCRPIFIIQGNVSMKKREKIIANFQASFNGVLLCTQQSLKNSVNIGSCNKCIIESLQWNIPKIEQFYFRFIRFDSVHKTEVHFINYNDTIEMNILALLMSKERINDFIKSLSYKEQSDIFNEFDVSTDIFNSIVEKEYDEKGKVHLVWGSQKVA